MGKLLEDRTYVPARKYTSKDDRHYIPVKIYNHQTGEEFIGRIKDDRDLQYVWDNTKSYGYICFGDEVLPFAKMKAHGTKGSYEFTLLVDSEKLFSPELKRLSILSINTGCGSILSSPEYKKIIGESKKRKKRMRW